MPRADYPGQPPEPHTPSPGAATNDAKEANNALAAKSVKHAKGVKGAEGTQRQAPRRSSRLAIVGAIVALLTGAWLMHDGSQSKNPPAPNSADALASASPGRSASPSATPTVPPMPYAVPDRIRIPALYVNAPLSQLGLDPKGNLQVPPDTNRNLAGWYKDGPAPGQAGAAVIAGHVDTMKGPAVFYGLGALHKGNTIDIHRADGRTAVFTIYGIEVYPKKNFPTNRVYSDPPGAELRLITCGGGFTKKTGYLGNVVVYARLTGTK